MLQINSNEVLSIDDVKDKAGSVFSESSSEDVSRLYNHISTSTIIDDMQLLGWHMVDAKEVKARKDRTKGFQKHLIVFRNNSLKIEDKKGDVVYPQILLTNSHDGRNSFTFTAGLFRMVCENGLVVSTENFGTIKIRHMGYNFEELQSKIKYMVSKLPLTIASMEKMKNIHLDLKEALEFAKKSIDIRFTEQEQSGISINLEDLISPIREEDSDDSLWVLYNIIQEKMISGNFEYEKEGKFRRARKISSFSTDIKINKDLFELAYGYVN